MIRFLTFMLLMLTGCMALVGATGIHSPAPTTIASTEVTTTATEHNEENEATPKPATTPKMVVTLNWTSQNMVFISKILVLMVIVLMAVLNYLSYLGKKENY